MPRVDRLERLTNLVLVLLDTPRPITLVEIAGAVGGYPDGHQARRQAFERDKRTLREEGIPISVEPVDAGGQLGYRIRPEDYYLPELELSTDEQVALNLAVAGVHLDDSSGREASLKLGLIGREQDAVALLPSLPALARLHRAIRDRAAASFTYHSRKRAVDPYGLLFRNGFWYLLGLDHGHGELRTYRVDRIAGDVSFGEAGSFERPADFEPGVHLPSEPWRLGEGGSVAAEVQVDSLLAPTVAAELGEEALLERRGDGSVVVRLEVTNPAAFRSWVLGLLDHAVVLGPEELRRELLQWLEAFSAGDAERGPA